METKQSAPSVSDSALRLPGQIPELPPDVLERFPSLAGWADEQKRFWSSAQQAMQDFASAVLDVTQVGGVLFVDGNAGSLYIKPGRGEGKFADPDTPFFVDSTGRFSLRNLLTWDPAAAELIVEGTIIADAGEIGGWIISPTTLSKNNAVLDSAGQLLLGTGNDIAILSATDATYRLWIGDATAGSATFSVSKTGAVFATAGVVGGFALGADYLRDTANSFGLASTITGGDDVRLWAGATFANRGTAPFRVTEGGAIAASSGVIGGFSIGTSDLSATDIRIDSGNAEISVGPSGQEVMLLVDAGVGRMVVNHSGGPRVEIGTTGLSAFLTLAGSAGSQIFLGDVDLTNGLDGALTVSGDIIAATFSGDGNGLTNLNPAEVAVSKTPTGDVPVDGYVLLGGVKVATVA